MKAPPVTHLGAWAPLPFHCVAHVSHCSSTGALAQAMQVSVLPQILRANQGRPAGADSWWCAAGRGEPTAGDEAAAFPESDS